jgi:hypothetical protein
MAKERITIEVDGEAVVHIAFQDLGFATLCGQDGDDPGIAMHPRETRRGAKVTCEQCRLIWRGAQGWTSRDFANET